MVVDGPPCHHAPMGEIVVVTGADLPIGRRLVVAALAESGVDRVVAVGAHPSQRRSLAAIEGVAELVVAPFALDDPRLSSLCEGATRLVLAGPRTGLDIDGTGGSELDLPATRSFLVMMARVADVSTVVVLSSALVYGARLANPVPMDEDAPVHPNLEIAAAVDRAELERVCGIWARSRRASCAFVRPCIVVGPDNGRWLARSPWSTSGLLVSDPGPVQFVHIDDLVDAMVRVCRSGVDGPVNVAPDGWLSYGQIRALRGPTARLRLSRPVAVVLARLGELFGLAPGDPDSLVAVAAPWVVTNDRLRALGWSPAHTNEEAYVDADSGGPWARLTPRHRQQLAMSAAGIGLLAFVVTFSVWLRRRLRPVR